MFHRSPTISARSLAVAAVILLVGVLFALSLSPPGTAHASHSGLPEVSIKAVMPEVGEEGRKVTVTLKLSRPLTDDEEWCYPGTSSSQTPNPGVCIQGGIIVWDTYDDHLYDVDGPFYDSGFVPSDRMYKFVFRGTEVEKRLNVSIANDACITPGRTVRIVINESFDETDTYGYTINSREFTVPVSGDDTTNGALVADGGNCAPVDDGAIEEFVGNAAPLFSDSEITLSVDENTAAGEPIDSPITANDPDSDDTLTYSLRGTDAASFNIDASTGQLETKDSLDHETKDTYHVAVFVRDGKNRFGDPDSTDDDSIDVTISVEDVNEEPAFDASAPTTMSVVENTAAGEPFGDVVTATDPDDGDTLTYSLDDGDGAAFEIDDLPGRSRPRMPWTTRPRTPTP